jgi:hypothetical protein
MVDGWVSEAVELGMKKHDLTGGTIGRKYKEDMVSKQAGALADEPRVIEDS